MIPEELADAIMIDYCYFYATGEGIDNTIYKEYTGVSNDRVIQNLKYIEKENK